jgi:hypothetical protein
VTKSYTLSLPFTYDDDNESGLIENADVVPKTAMAPRRMAKGGAMVT